MFDHCCALVKFSGGYFPIQCWRAHCPPQCQRLSTGLSTPVMDPHLAATASLARRAGSAASAITGKLSAFLSNLKRCTFPLRRRLFLSQHIFETIFDQQQRLLNTRSTAAFSLPTPCTWLCFARITVSCPSMSVYLSI